MSGLISASIGPASGGAFAACCICAGAAAWDAPLREAFTDISTSRGVPEALPTSRNEVALGPRGSQTAGGVYVTDPIADSGRGCVALLTQRSTGPVFRNVARNCEDFPDAFSAPLAGGERVEPMLAVEAF